MRGVCSYDRVKYYNWREGNQAVCRFEAFQWNFRPSCRRKFEQMNVLPAGAAIRTSSFRQSQQVCQRFILHSFGTIRSYSYPHSLLVAIDELMIWLNYDLT